MAKRLNIMMEGLPKSVDLFVLEFAVNDYQGQDHKTMIDFKMDVFFEGFDRIALCTETVVHKILHRYPDAAIVFLEMRTAIMARKTASALHMGAAQHYQIPVLSYDQALFPDYQFLLKTLQPFNYSTRKGDTVLPYPHGCHPCIRDHIVEGFRPKGCATMCRIQQFSPVDAPPDCTIHHPEREPCYIPFFAHDEVHPSGMGHKIASDLIINAIASTARDVCQKSETFKYNAMLPTTGWMVSDPSILDRQNNFIMVNDTYEIFVRRRKLEATANTSGFTFYQDAFDRYGWIATNPAGGESVQFDFDFPVQECYVPYLSVLKSYKKMGVFTVTLLDKNTLQQTSLEVDGLWKPTISVPSDIALTEDLASPMACTGRCSITVTTQPEIKGRNGNKVKIITLSVRKCIK